MWPTLYEVQTSAGPVGIHTYGLFIVLAFSAAFLLVHFRAARVGLHPDRLISTYVAAAIGGLTGGRLLYAVAVDWERTISDPLSLFSCAGFALYGGVAGGAIGVGINAWFQKIDAWKLADLAGPAILIGIAVGRMGCFFAGCCHGAAAPIGDDPIGLLPGSFSGGQLWLSEVFPFLTSEVHGGVTRAELLHTPLYPTQLWTVVGEGSLAIFLAWLWTRRRFDGQIMALMLILEPPLRSFIESFRADHRGYAITFPVSEEVAGWLPGLTRAGAELEGAVMGITTSQMIGVGMMVLGVVIYALRRNAGVSEEVAAVRSEGDDDLDAALLE